MNDAFDAAIRDIGLACRDLYGTERIHDNTQLNLNALVGRDPIVD